MPARSHNSNLVGDLESVVILGQDNVGLLLAAGSDESIDLADFDRVKILDGLLNQRLGGTLVNDENESVVVFNSLDSALGGSGVSNNGVVVPGVLFGN